MFRLFNGLGRSPGSGIMPGQTLTRVTNKALNGSSAELPKDFVSDATDTLLLHIFRHAQPAILATGFRPQLVSSRRIPGRVMNSVGDVADGDFVHRQSRKERRK